ncbi:TPA: hypothetical protein VJE30_001322 [Streptococcus pyogenes]|nr:hypothetical protein [Streptococcus pyogenes]
MSENIDTKVIRGYYLTGLGQEPLAYYFKISKEHSDFKTIKSGDVAMTFYQNGETITSIPALIRVDGIISSRKVVLEYLQKEQKDHFPMLPIIQIYDHFDPLLYAQMTASFGVLKNELRQLAKFQIVQGNLFEFLEEEEKE